MAQERRVIRVTLLLPFLTIGLLSAPLRAFGAAEPLSVSVGGPPEDPAYLPVYAAAALGTFEAEGVQPILRRAKHPAGAITALRDRETDLAVATLDQAVRGAWARGTPVRIVVAHTRAPADVLLVSARHRTGLTRVEDLRGAHVGIPGPGTTGHLLLLALLRAAGVAPWQLEVQSFGGAALVSHLASGSLAAAVVDEPWASRALASGAASALVDFRRPEVTLGQLGGPFHEIVSVTRAADKSASSRLESPLAGFARAVIRVQTWLAATAPESVADRLPADLVGNRERFVERLAGRRDTYAPDGEATEAGLAATLRVLRLGTPWPISLKVEPADLREPGFVTAARVRLGPQPPPP